MFKPIVKDSNQNLWMLDILDSLDWELKLRHGSYSKLQVFINDFFLDLTLQNMFMDKLDMRF